MISKKTTIFKRNNKQYRFDFEAFDRLFRNYAKRKEMTYETLEGILGDYSGFSKEAVHNWRFRSNGPRDIETISKLAEGLEINSDTHLLREIIIEGDKKRMDKNALTERQLNAAKRIYSAIVVFMNDFERTMGFNDYWFQFNDLKNPEDGIYDLVEKKHNEIFLVYEEEYFDLHGTEIYEEYGEFINNALYDTYDGKLSYAYRFEAEPEGNPTVSEDYDKAMNQLNGIIEKYT